MLKNTFNTNIDSGLCGLFKIALVHRNFVNDIIVLEIYVLITIGYIKRIHLIFAEYFTPAIANFAANLIKASAGTYTVYTTAYLCSVKCKLHTRSAILHPGLSAVS